MTVQDLQKLTNEKIQFSVSSDSVVIRSWTCKYADMVHVVDIESVEMSSSTVVRISVPVGTRMGDHEILADLSTGIVTADGKTFDEPMPEFVPKSQPQKKARTTFTPSINGFSIKSVKTMPSEDGYALYCKVYFNDRKIGEFVDKGDGGEYSFYADIAVKSRLYQAHMDVNQLSRGESFNALKPSFLIFICKFDPFSLGLRRYTFSQRCKEKSHLSLDDGATKVFFSTTGQDGNQDTKLNRLLDYMNDTASYPEASKEGLVREIDDAVHMARTDEQFRSFLHVAGREAHA